MDVNLFPTYDVPSTLYAHVAERRPTVTAEAFAQWPEHMRREFALLAAEAGLDDARVGARSGIAPAALVRARAGIGLFALTYSEARGPSTDEECMAREADRRYRARRRAADA